MIVGLVVVVAVGAFLAGWMARHAQLVARGEMRYWAQVEARPALYDWSTDEGSAE